MSDPGTTDRNLLPIQVPVRRILWSTFLVCVGLFVLYIMQDRIAQALSSSEDLRSIEPIWFVVMVVSQGISFACLWWLTRIVLPGTPWMLASTSQLVSNSVSRAVPGGAAAGGAVYFRMLAVSGIKPTEAGGALAATSVLSNAILFSIPAVAGLMALLGAPIPDSLIPPAVAASGAFFLFVGIGAICSLYDKPLALLEKGIDQLARGLGRIFRRSWHLPQGKLLFERDRLVKVLGSRWPQAVAAAAGNWLFDYLSLVAALYAAGGEPKFLLVLLAFAFTSVLAMFPATPGGFGPVEAGLFTMLVLFGYSATEASLATVAYRLVSFVLPLAVGPLAYVVFARWQHRNGLGRDRGLATDS
jgi:uncharacterized membrane protein YbhN (UPF0104 family)